MKYVFAVMEHVPYEGSFLWALYSTKARARRELEAFKKKTKCQPDREFKVEKRKLDQSCLEFKSEK